MILLTLNSCGSKSKLGPLIDFIQAQQPDVCCIQELKVVAPKSVREVEQTLQLALGKEYEIMLYPGVQGGQGGHSGVATLVRKQLGATFTKLFELGEFKQFAGRVLIAATNVATFIMFMVPPRGSRQNS